MIDRAEIERGAALLRAGGLVIFPTETVYGLGCDAANPKAVAKLYAAKGRPSFNPLIAHVRDPAEAERHALLHPIARELANAFWPGPLTLVARRRQSSEICELACAGLASVALRAPSHPVAQALLAAFAGPIVAPSANLSGRVSATQVAHIPEELRAQVDLVLDDGPSLIGLESTIVSVDEFGRVRLLRPGAVTREALEAITGPMPSGGEAIEAPGMMASHYAPRARLRLEAAAPHAGEVYLAFGAPAPPGGLTLSARGDLIEAAANLYAHLRSLDESGAEMIAVAPIPSSGIGEAINDRLRRAAAPR